MIVLLSIRLRLVESREKEQLRKEHGESKRKKNRSTSPREQRKFKRRRPSIYDVDGMVQGCLVPDRGRGFRALGHGFSQSHRSLAQAGVLGENRKKSRISRVLDWL